MWRFQPMISGRSFLLFSKSHGWRKCLFIEPSSLGFYFIVENHVAFFASNRFYKLISVLRKFEDEPRRGSGAVICSHFLGRDWEAHWGPNVKRWQISERQLSQFFHTAFILPYAFRQLINYRFHQFRSLMEDLSEIASRCLACFVHVYWGRFAQFRVFSMWWEGRGYFNSLRFAAMMQSWWLKVKWTHNG